MQSSLRVKIAHYGHLVKWQKIGYQAAKKAVCNSQRFVVQPKQLDTAGGCRYFFSGPIWYRDNSCGDIKGIRRISCCGYRCKEEDGKIRIELCQTASRGRRFLSRRSHGTRKNAGGLLSRRSQAEHFRKTAGAYRSSCRIHLFGMRSDKRQRFS